MGRTTRRTDRTPPPARGWRRVSGPGLLLGVVTLAVSATGWGLLLAGVPSGDVTPSMALGSGAFAGAAVVASVWAWATRPGGLTARYALLAQVRPTDPIGDRGHALGWPPKPLWQLPLLQTVLFVLTVPVAYVLEPGDHSIWGAVAVYGLLVAYAGLLAAVLVGSLVVMPLVILGRVAYLLIRRRPLPQNDVAVLVLALILLPIVLFATGIVLGTPGASDKGDQTAAFFGAGDQSSPWLWVARGSMAFLVATIATAFVHFRRVAARTDTGTPAAAVPTD